MSSGKVYLVGAGPGSPDLISLRGWRLLRQADLIIADGLLPPTFLDQLGIPVQDKIVDWRPRVGAGKSQSEINQRMVAAAQRGQTVVRLKTGDPFVFGRGGEEIDFLAKHGIAWEVVPGASSCTAVPAAAGMPLSQRGETASFAVASARSAGGGVNSSYPRADNLIIVMSVQVLGQVVERLLADGWSAETPAAVIERATLPWERRVTASLGRIQTETEAAGISSPALLLVGPVAGRRDSRAGRPRVLFTGLDPANFRTLGDLIHWPALKVARNEAGCQILATVIDELTLIRVSWIVFTSKAGVDIFMAALAERQLDARRLAGARIGAAGTGTAARLAEHGLYADLVPQKSGSQGIIEAIGPGLGARLLLVQGSHAPRKLEAGLEERGWKVFRVSLHQVTQHPELGRPLPEHDVIYFVSPSGVRAYWEAYGKEAFGREIWCIGEVTQSELAKIGQNGKVVDPHVPEHQNAPLPELQRA